MMYCAEWPDNSDGQIRNLIIDQDAVMQTEFIPEMLNGAQIIKTKGRQSRKTNSGEILYGDTEDVTLIPYHLWANRGSGEMLVWLPITESSANPLPAPTIASTSTISSSKPSKSLKSITDQYEPKNSNDHTNPYFHWWPNKNQTEWIQYDFDKVTIVSSSRVYWFDDGPDGDCRIPDKWEILYRSGNKWIPVKHLSEYHITKDEWNNITFEPVKTSAVRINVKLSKEYSSGIHEWIIN